MKRVLANLSLCYEDVDKKENAVEYILKFAYTTWKEYGKIDIETVESIPEVLEELENIKTERAKKVARAIEEHRVFVPMDGVKELFLELLRFRLRKCI